MIHRKEEHKSIVKRCTKYQQNSCPYKICWFLHEEDNNTFDRVQTEQSDDIKSVFQKVDKIPIIR